MFWHKGQTKVFKMYTGAYSRGHLFQSSNRNYNVHLPEKCSCLLASSPYSSCLWANHDHLLAYPHQSESSTQSWLNGYWQYWPVDRQLISLVIDKEIDTILTNRHICVETHGYTYSALPPRQSGRHTCQEAKRPMLNHKGAIYMLMEGVLQYSLS